MADENGLREQRMGVIRDLNRAKGGGSESLPAVAPAVEQRPQTAPERLPEPVRWPQTDYRSMGTLLPSTAPSPNLGQGANKNSDIEMNHIHPYYKEPRTSTVSGESISWSQSTNELSWKDESKRVVLDKRMLKAKKTRAKISKDLAAVRKKEKEQQAERRRQWREQSKFHQAHHRQELWAPNRLKVVNKRLRKVKTKHVEQTKARMLKQLKAANLQGLEVATELPAPHRRPSNDLDSVAPTPEQARTDESLPSAGGANNTAQSRQQNPAGRKHTRELEAIVAQILSGAWAGVSVQNDAGGLGYRKEIRWDDCQLSFCAPTLSEEGAHGVGRLFGHSLCDESLVGYGRSMPQRLGFGTEDGYELERRRRINLDGMVDFNRSGSNKLVIHARQGDYERFFTGSLVWEADRNNKLDPDGKRSQNGGGGRGSGSSGAKPEAEEPFVILAQRAIESAIASARAADGKGEGRQGAENGNVNGQGQGEEEPLVMPSGTVSNELTTQLLHHVMLKAETDDGKEGIELVPTGRKLTAQFSAFVPPRFMLETTPTLKEKYTEIALTRGMGVTKGSRARDEPLSKRTGYFTPMHHTWRPANAFKLATMTQEKVGVDVMEMPAPFQKTSSSTVHSMGSEMGRPGGLALSGVREQESVYGLQQALNMGVKWRSAGKRTNNSSHSYQKLMERANMLNLGLKGRRKRELLQTKKEKSDRENGWARAVYIAVFWIRTVWNPMKEQVLRRQNEAATCLQRFAGRANNEREWRQVRREAIDQVYRFLKRFASLVMDSEDNWLKHVKRRAALERKRLAREKADYEQEVAAEETLGSTYLSHLSRRMSKPQNPLPSYLSTEKEEQDRANKALENARMGAISTVFAERAEAAIPSRLKNKSRHVRMFLVLYRRVSKLRHAIGRFFRNILHLKRAQARAMNVLWAQVRKEYGAELLKETGKILAEGLELEKTVQRKVGQGEKSDWIWLTDSKMWVDLPEETEPPKDSDDEEEERQEELLKEGNTKGMMLGISRQPLNAKSSGKKARPMGKGLLREDTDKSEFNTFAFQDLPTKNWKAGVKFETHDEKEQWRAMVISTVMQVTSLRTSFNQWKIDLAQSFYKSKEEWKKAQHARYMALDFDEKQLYKQRQKDGKIQRVKMVEDRGKEIKANFLADRQAKKDAAAAA
eukprot:g1212.t1